MSFKEYFFRNVFMTFVIVTAFVTIAMGILGMIYLPEQKFGYEAFFAPMIYGVFTSIPSLITYSKKELSVRTVVIKQIIQMLLVVGIVLCMIYTSGALKTVSMGISLVASVLVIYAIVWLVEYQIELRMANKMNQALRKFQDQE